MSLLPPSQPAEGEPACAARPSPETLALLAARRSVKIAELRGPGPTPDQVDALIALAARAPDHGKLGPWRFLVIEGEARRRAGEALAELQAGRGVSDPAVLEAERARFERAPVVVTVISTAAPHAKIPEWEQVLSSGAVCFQLLVAAHAAGFAGCWLTEWPTYDEAARAALGLAAHERVAGFVYLGSAAAAPLERVRASTQERIQRF